MILLQGIIGQGASWKSGDRNGQNDGLASLIFLDMLMSKKVSEGDLTIATITQ